MSTSEINLLFLLRFPSLSTSSPDLSITECVSFLPLSCHFPTLYSQCRVPMSLSTLRASAVRLQCIQCTDDHFWHVRGLQSPSGRHQSRELSVARVASGQHSGGACETAHPAGGGTTGGWGGSATEADRVTISHQLTNLAPCSVPMADTHVYPKRFVRIATVHCQICGSRRDAAVTLLCDTCNRGFHTWCLTPPLSEVPVGHWHYDEHQVSSPTDLMAYEGCGC